MLKHAEKKHPQHFPKNGKNCILITEDMSEEYNRKPEMMEEIER